MKRAFILLALACASLLTATVASAAKPIYLERGPFQFLFPFYDCSQFDGMDYWLWAAGETMEVGKAFFDKDGLPVKTVGKEYTTDGNIWIPAQAACHTIPFTGCTIPELFEPMPGTNVITDEGIAGRPEHTNVIWRDWIWVDHDPNVPGGYWYPTWGQHSGITMHIGVPGYGQFFAKAGHMTHRFDPETHEWELLSMTPNWTQPKTEDFYAACAYVGNM